MNPSLTLTDEQRRRMEENRLKAIEKRNAAIAKRSVTVSSGHSIVNTFPKTGETATSTTAATHESTYKSYLSGHGHPRPITTAGSIMRSGNSVPNVMTLAGPPVTVAGASSFSVKPNVTGSPMKPPYLSGYGHPHPTTTRKAIMLPINSIPNRITSTSAVSVGGAPNTKPMSSVPVKSKVTGSPVKPPPPFHPAIMANCVLFSRERFYVEMVYHPESIAIFKSIPNCKYEPTTRKWSFPIREHVSLMKAMESLKPNVRIVALPIFIQKIFRNATEKYIPEADYSILNRIDPTLVDTLFQFQKEGICFGINRNGRVLIADDMGLGKTIQALGIAHFYREEWPLLIVAPSSMRYGWREAVWKWLPSVSPGAVSIINSKADWDSVSFSKVIIVSYDLVQKRKDDLQNIQVVIFDESHNLKNIKTIRAKTSIPIIQQAKRAILLSGTPALSRPVELFTQISSISRNLFPNYTEYGLRYCSGRKNQWGWDFSGASNMEELQLVLEETIMIRRMKSNVLKQLPAKRRQMLILDPALVRCSSKGLQTKASAFNEGKHLKGAERQGKLLEYFSETGKAKLDAIANYITELVEDGKKFLCFAHHHVVLDRISETLENLQCKYIRIDGQTPAEERLKLCDHFQLKQDVKVAVLSIQAANSGITLTSAHLIVFAELFWNPGILTQAEDRAHRIGQEDSVLVQYLVAKGTADDFLWRIVVDKLDVLNKVGLSKDNFNEADAESLIQQLEFMDESNCGNSQSSQSHPLIQKGIDSYFQPFHKSPPLPSLSTNNDYADNGRVHVNTTTIETVTGISEEDMACLFADDFDDEDEDEDEAMKCFQ